MSGSHRSAGADGEDNTWTDVPGGDQVPQTPAPTLAADHRPRPLSEPSQKAAGPIAAAAYAIPSTPIARPLPRVHSPPPQRRSSIVGMIPRRERMRTPAMEKIFELHGILET